MRIEKSWLEELVFSGEAPRRFTQDSPVLPDVWLTYGAKGEPDKPLDVLFTPFRQTSPGALSQRFAEVLGDSGWAANSESKGQLKPRGAKKGSHRLAINQAVVAAELRLAELVRIVICCSEWWRTLVRPENPPEARWFLKPYRPSLVRQMKSVADRQLWNDYLRDPGATGEPEEPSKKEVGSSKQEVPTALLWFIRLAGTIDLALRAPAPTGKEQPSERLAKIAWDFPAQIESFVEMAGDTFGASIEDDRRFFIASRNRRASPALDRSVVTIKADSARRLFEISCARLTWAVVDSGIDATHPAFRIRDAKAKLKPEFDPAGSLQTRVIKTYDFTRMRELLDPNSKILRDYTRGRQTAQQAARFQRMLQSGAMLDWEPLLDLIEVSHKRGQYQPPKHDHGTHVAGILASDWRTTDDKPGQALHPGKVDLVGVCPDLKLYDLRIFSGDGSSDEFAVMAALQFLRWLNERGDQPAVHGVNLSLSIEHDVTNFACGRTPVCLECSRLVHSGTVVVAAAGNEGRAQFQLASGGSTEGYRNMSISDPGNTEEVITVGSTHRQQPHSYGVSYFSSRGPTGDGRLKPDLVAPGEKITSPVPGGAGTKDGTSMAAPHVSGAAALLLARYRELVNNPAEVKRILCTTATDLGRERTFQGNGLVDVLRALQAV